MKISFDKKAGVSLMLLSGALDVEACETVLAAGMAVAEEKPDVVVIDLSRCVYISSLGLGVLLRIHQLQVQHGGTLRLAGATPAVLSVFHAVQFDQRLPVDVSVEAALEAVRVSETAKAAL